MALICPSCGEHNRDGAPFCGMCKAVLTRTTKSPAPAPAAALAPTPNYREPAAGTSREPCLVFLDPPHAPALDLPLAASVLRLQLADARMRVGAPAPLPVLLGAETDAEHAMHTLERAGISASVAPVAELLATPEPEDLARFGLDATRLTFETRTPSRGELAWHELRAAFVVVETVFVQGTDHAGRAATERASGELARAWSAWNAARNRSAARRSLRKIEDDLALAGSVRRDERTELSLHLVSASASGRLHLVCPMASASSVISAIARHAPDVALDRRAERAPLRLPPIPGIAAVFDGEVPSAADLMSAYLAWKHTR